MAKINTAGCVKAICEHTGQSESWKRSKKYFACVEQFDKYGQASKAGRTCIREFEVRNDTLRRTAYVFEKENKIVDVRILTEMNDCERTIDLATCNFASVPYYELIEDEDNPDDVIYEAQDFENCDVESIDGGSMTLEHGGDWQSAVTATYRLMSDNQLYLVEYTRHPDDK